MKGLKRVLGLVALSVTLLPSRAADACSCVPPDARILPSETTLTVPSNTRIWVVGTQYCGAVTLADGQGSDVGLTYTNFDPDVRALTPAQELTVGARYTITCEAGQVTHFTVTDEADWRAPTTPLVEIGEHTSYESTGAATAAIASTSSSMSFTTATCSFSTSPVERHSSKPSYFRASSSR